MYDIHATRKCPHGKLYDDFCPKCECEKCGGAGEIQACDGPWGHMEPCECMSDETEATKSHE